MNPYNIIQKDLNAEIRIFKNNINSEDLLWHFDEEDRIVEILEGIGWFLQMDNHLPIELVLNTKYFIPKNVYHRIFKKGISDLKIKITFI